MKKAAFLVGINKYSKSPLKGCVNDVQLLRTALTELGFDVSICVDEQATKQNILAGLNELVSSSEADDILLFHFSGHGAQIVDVHNDESDGYDEVICPIDVFDGNYITDDDLNVILDSVHKKATLDIILDCCHAGTGTRGEINVGSDGFVPDRLTGRFIDAQETLSQYLTPNKKLASKQARNHSDGIILWAACRDYETAADALLNDAYNGVFTVNLIESWAQARHDSRYNIMESIKKSMLRFGFTQVPQLECRLIDSKVPFLMNAALAKTLNIDVHVPVRKVIGYWIRHILDKFDF